MSSQPRANTIPSPVLTHTKIQATAVLGLGLTYLLSPPSLLHNIERSLSQYLPFLPSPSTTISPTILNHPLLARQQQISGVVLMGIGSVYFLSLYYRQYEYVYMTVPGRLIIAGAGLLSWVVAPERVGVTLALVVLNDGLGALLAAWFLGWDGLIGRVPRVGMKRE